MGWSLGQSPTASCRKSCSATRAPAIGPVAAIMLAPRRSRTSGGVALSSAASNSAGVTWGTAQNFRKRYFCHSFQPSQMAATPRITTSARAAWRSSATMADCTVSCNSQPAPIASPAHKPAPTAAASRKPPWCMRNAPAMGGATVEKPGMNLATTRDDTPQRMKRASVWLTQDDGLIDSLHSPASTR